jgi:hypothetical protein
LLVAEQAAGSRFTSICVSCELFLKFVYDIKQQAISCRTFFVDLFL